METDAIQLLHLSPIPELSEIELSTMLDQLSSFSDQNSEMTDRNIEEIIKEAEDFMDQAQFQKLSSSGLKHKFSTLSDVENNINPEENVKITRSSQEKVLSNKGTEKDQTASEIDDAQLVSSRSSISQEFNSLSPRNSGNLIKSTIDSLREYSSAVEKQIVEKQPSNLPNYSNSNILNFSEKIKDSNDSFCESFQKSELKETNTKQGEPLEKKISIQRAVLDKPVKKVSCFERLYKSKPVRSSGKPKNQEPSNKIIKSSAKEKKTINIETINSLDHFLATERNVTKAKCLNQAGTLREHSQNVFCKKKVDGKLAGKNNELKHDLAKYKIDNLQNENEPEDNSLYLEKDAPNMNDTSQPFLTYRCKELKPEENLIQKLLQELKEIKEKIQPFDRHSSPRKPDRHDECEEQMSDFEIDSIHRLHRQFVLLKDKYEEQIKKMEIENDRLKEILNGKTSQQTQNIENPFDGRGLVTKADRREEETSEGGNVRRSLSLGNLWDSEKKKISIFDLNVGKRKSFEGFNEAFSQTENQFKNVSVQCENGGKSKEEKEEEEKEERDFVSTSDEKKTVENKENFLSKKKFPLGKQKLPFCQTNQIPKQRKISSETETQLMIALRRIRAEALDKEKENRKLRTEVEWLKNQLKRVGVKKNEICVKKCHVGSQTIGFGPLNQETPYDPRTFTEETDKLERENEELRARILALEDSFELLKEKRINDLRSLHQVHEKEMAKLVSKLESQSALTKHLHSLLIKP